VIAAIFSSSLDQCQTRLNLMPDKIEPNSKYTTAGRQGADMQTKVEELEMLNQSLRNREVERRYHRTIIRPTAQHNTY
jgi:hypothetical protein